MTSVRMTLHAVALAALMALGVGVLRQSWPSRHRPFLALVVVVAWVGVLLIPVRPPTLAELRQRSITPADEEQGRIFEMVLERTREPILSVLDRATIQGEVAYRLDPENGVEVPFQEYFPFDLRIRTGRVLAPRAGGGHVVAVRRNEAGEWEIAEVGRWVS